MKKKSSYLLGLLLCLCLILLLVRTNKRTCEKKEKKITLSTLLPGACTETKAQCDAECKGFRCINECKEGRVCGASESNCYGSEEDCKSTCKGYRCNVSECKQGTTPCSATELTEGKCFLTSSCGTGCAQTVFDRINAGQDIVYKIVNNTTQRQVSSTQPVSGNGNWNPTPAYFPYSDTAPNSMNPGMFWKFQGTSGKFLIVSEHRNTVLENATFAGNNDGHTVDGGGGATLNGMLFTIEVVDASQGICRLKISDPDNYLALGHVANAGFGANYGNGCGESIPCMLKFQWNKDDTYAKWKIIPYTKAKVKLP